MTLSCYGCSQEIIYENGRKYNLDNSDHNCPKTNRKSTTTSSYTPKPKSSYQKTPTEPTARDIYMKGMQESKQTHEVKIMEANNTNSQLIADSNNAIAIALNKVAESLHEYAQSARFVKEKQK
jgi:hypothetical protein